MTESKSDKDFDLWKASDFTRQPKKDLDGAKSDANMQKEFDKVKSWLLISLAKLSQAKADAKQAQDS